MKKAMRHVTEWVGMKQFSYVACWLGSWPVGEVKAVRRENSKSMRCEMLDESESEFDEEGISLLEAELSLEACNVMSR